MGGLRPLEVLALSLAAPATLFLLLWFWAFPGKGAPLKPPSPGGEAGFQSRTRPVRVFEGELPDHRKLRVFQGLTPGLGGTEAGRRALRLLGREGRWPALTLLVRNDSGRKAPSLAGGWALFQGEDRKWRLASPLHPRNALGRLLAGLYSPGDFPIPPGGVARHLFLPSRSVSPPAGKPLFLEGPLGRITLSPRTLPAQDVLQAWERTKKG